MRTYRLETVDASTLRIVAPDGEVLDSRPLAGMDALIEGVEDGYGGYTPDHGRLGSRLHDWLAGPRPGWLDAALAGAGGVTLSVDVAEGLRHLPWELMVRDGSLLCADARRPFTPVRRVSARAGDAMAHARPLRVLFMACSPEGVEPLLDFEGEEALILSSTHDASIELVVEESGSLAGLRERLEALPPGYFDVFHLVGHATASGGRPRFLMEDELGVPREAAAGEIADAFRGRPPRLVFLSGCSTGQAPARGSLPSMAEELVRAGTQAVLGWALPVPDLAASRAAASLFAHLGAGTRLDEAVARARLRLWKTGSSAWHLLRLYADGTPLTSIVSEPGSWLRTGPAPPEAASEFLDAGQVEVCPRWRFVGRRRVVQRCLRVLRAEPGEEAHAEGVLLHGMGGLGKTSVAARLCERMRDHARVVVVGALTEDRLVRAFSLKLQESGLDAAVATLQQPDVPLGDRLRLSLASSRSLFVFDDFEKSLEDPTSAGSAREVLAALLDAVREAGSASRVIVTSRYTVSLPGPARLWEEGLETMRGAELMKKAGQLRGFARTRPEVARRALQVGAGNPRLLDRLDAALAAGGTEVGALLSELEETAAEFREALLLDRLLARQEPGLRRLVALASVYGLPVGREAVDAVAGAGPAAAHLDRAVALSLVDRGRDPAGGGFRYFVSELLVGLVRGELDGAELREARARGAEFLHRGWKEERLPESEPLLLEIHRLALAAGAAEVAVEATGALTRRWLTHARFRDVENVCVRTLALREDHRVLNDLGYAERSLGKTEQARRRFERAVEIVPESDAASTVLERAELVHNLAELTVLQGDVERGMELYRTALELEERIGSAHGKAATLHQMALVHLQRGELDLALDLLRSSLRLKEEVGDERGRAATLHMMGVIYAQQGNAREALEHYGASLELKERTGNVQGTAATLHAMAVLHTDQGDARRALQLYRASLALWEQTGEVHGTAATLRAMATVHEQQGDAAQALDLLQSSLQLEREIGNVQGEAATLQAMAVVYHGQGDLERALATCRSAQDVAERASDVHVKAATLGLTGNLLFRLGRREEAREALAGSIRAFEVARAWSELCVGLFNLSVVDPARAASLLGQALWLAARVQMPPSGLLSTATAVFGAIGPGGDAAPVVAAGTLLLVVERTRTHPDAEALQQEAGNLLGDAAEARGITPATFQPWLDRERLLERDYVLPRMLRALEEMVPEADWLFDRRQVGSGPTDSPET